MVVKNTFLDLPFLEDVLDEASSGSGCQCSISTFIVVGHRLPISLVGSSNSMVSSPVTKPLPTLDNTL
jgi:hypothetical protein